MTQPHLGDSSPPGEPELGAAVDRRTIAWWALLVALATALTASLAVAGQRVMAIEGREVSEASDVLTLGELPTARMTLVEAELHRDDAVVFELCSSSQLDPASWDGRLEVAIVRRAAPDEDVLRTALDGGMLAAARRASGRGTCLDVGRGVIDIDGRYATEVAWHAALPESGVQVRARTLATHPLLASDRNLVLALLALSIALCLALYGHALGRPRAAAPLGIAVALATLAGTVLFLFMRFGTPRMPGGASGGLASGLSLALLEVALAVALVRGSRAAVLGVGRELSVEGVSTLRRARPYLLLALAPIAGLALFRIAGLALRYIPATGEAPIEAFVSSPSGMLSFASLAVVAPIAEEVFFRGFVYGVLRGDGGAHRAWIAFVGSWLVFAAIHLPQTWGSWGGVVSIAVAALGFTALRAASGSIVVPAIAHLIYNGLLSAQALLSAS